jgi:hypothetical protein
MFRACVESAGLSLLDKLRGNVVRVSRAMHSIAVLRVAERSAVFDRGVSLASKDQRHLDVEIRIDFDSQAFVQVYQDSRFGKKDYLAMRARWI